MKKIIVILSLIIVVISVKSQINFNNNTINAGNYSSAIGEQNTSTGLSSFASGKLNISQGSYSISLGYGISATGNSSFGAGLYNTLSGGYSIGIGNYLSATQTQSFIIGTGYDFNNPMENNIPNSLMVGFGSTKPTFFISTATASDETGDIAIGDVTSPLAKLHIRSDYGEDAVLLIVPNSWNSDGWAEVQVGNNANAMRGSYTYGLQFKTDKNYLFNSPNAKVGIGTLTPTEKLEVAGNIKASGTGYMMTSKVQAIDNKGLSLTNTGGTGITIANDGKVGIGTISTPTEKLDVNGKVKSTSLQITTGFANGKLLQSDAFGNAVWTNPAWTISGSNAYKMTGNVGIGTYPTSNRLEVSGTLNASYYTGNGSLLTDVKDYRWQNTYNSQISTNGKVIIGYGNYTGTDLTDITDPQLDVRAMVEYNHKLANFVDGDGRRIFLVTKIDGYNSIASVDDAGIFWSDSQADSSNQNEYAGFVIGPHRDGTAKGIKIDKDGNVGIGKAVPTAMLDVNGDAKIGGTLTADNFNIDQLTLTTFAVTEILYAGEIHVQDLSGWKDCVFENSYNLMSLKETEEFIKHNKHLPGIPSEKEVMENGIDVGEMNALLLQKIEELTLHVIELEKKINENK